VFSSLSESGFIPTKSYFETTQPFGWCSHLFQRVASFLLYLLQSMDWDSKEEFSSLSESGFIPTQSNMSYVAYRISKFSSLSESGFIPTRKHQITRLSRSVVLISFREWLHSYPVSVVNQSNMSYVGSHLFQRVASFLRTHERGWY